MDDAAMLTIGQLADRTGLPVRTIRYWSDIGAVPPVARVGRDHRRYDAAGVARLELVATLRELGLGLAEIRRVLDHQATMADVAAAHVGALDAQIRTLRLRRALLTAVARRKPGTEEMTLMNKLARLSAQERKQIIDDFVGEVFGGLEPEPGLAARMRQATPDLPDDPSADQVDAWVELAELVQDPGFRRRIRAMAGQGVRAAAAEPATGGEQAPTPDFAARALEHAGPAAGLGVAPDSGEAADVLDKILGGTPADQRRPELREQLESGTDARAERYWQLLGIINGWPPFPSHVPAFEWLIAALRAHPQPARPPSRPDPVDRERPGGQAPR
jgi:DNA-binding transcriptional MerR regulator